MPRPFQCPTCGAPLDVPSDVGTTMRCPYCSNSVIIPRELRDGDGPEWIEVNLASLTGDPDKLHELRNAMLAGKKMEAIKIFRELYDVGLADAQDNIQDLMDGKLIRVRREVPNAASISVMSVSGATPRQSEAFQQALASGNKIEAIKIYREMTGLGLKQSKDAVEAIQAGLNLAGGISSESQPIPPQPKASRQVARTLGCILVLFFLIVGISVAGILLALAPASRAVTESIVVVSTEIVIPEIFEPTQDPSYAPLVRRIGKEGVCGGCFEDLRSVAQSSDGTIYATDYEGGRIQVFDAQGTFLTQWIIGEGYTNSLAVGRDGSVFVTKSGQLLRYQSDGTLLGEFLVEGGDGFDDVWPLAGGGMAAFRYTVKGDDIAVFDDQGNVTLYIAEAISGQTGDSELRGRVAADGLGNLYALGTFNDLVLIYDSQGKYLNQIGGTGDETGQFRAAEDVAVDQQGRIYVSDIKGIQVFDPNGRYIGLIPDQGQAIFGLYINDQNELLAAARTEILVFRLP